MAGRRHDLAMYRGQGTFSAKYENGTPWTLWKDKLLKMGLPVCQCSTAAIQHAAWEASQ